MLAETDDNLMDAFFSSGRITSSCGRPSAATRRSHREGSIKIPTVTPHALGVLRAPRRRWRGCSRASPARLDVLLPVAICSGFSNECPPVTFADVSGG